jgi:Fe-S-cluster-containing hydrogenase component 2
LRQRLEARFHHDLTRQIQMENQPQTGNLISFLVAQGLGEATDVLLIDESLCIHCDNCERACAEVHNGTSRLDRQAGPTFNTIHVPTSCRHCEHPHCMKDCPPDAIHRAENGEVFIADNCIGCGHCEKNCPYGVIQMAHPIRQRTHLWRWLFFGWGNEPGRSLINENKDLKNTKAVKCDMCKDLKGAMCVRACPTGAAKRVSPDKFLTLATPN